MADKPTWLILGDEFIQEMFRYLRAPLADRVVADVIGSQDSTYASWLYGGAPGAVSGQSRSGLQINVQEVRPAATVIVLGTNPGGVDIPDYFNENVRTAVAEAARYSGQVVLVGPFGNDPSGKRLAALRRVVPDAIDGTMLSMGLPRGPDGVHFTQDGYRQLTDRMVTTIFDVLVRRATKPPLTTTTPSTTPPSTEPSVPVPCSCPPGYSLTDWSVMYPSPSDAVAPTGNCPPSNRSSRRLCIQAAVLQPATVTPPPGTTPGTTTTVTPTVTPLPGADAGKTEPGAPATAKKSSLPLVIGGLAVVGVIGLAVYYSRRKKAA